MNLNKHGNMVTGFIEREWRLNVIANYYTELNRSNLDQIDYSHKDFEIFRINMKNIATLRRMAKNGCRSALLVTAIQTNNAK